MGRDERPGDDPLLRQMFFDFANDGEQDIVRMLRTLASSPAFCAARGGTMTRELKRRLTRRDLIKRFGPLAFVLTPVARAMGYVAGGTFVGAPRFVMFFKGGVVPLALDQPDASITSLAGTPLAPLAPHAQDLILFSGHEHPRRLAQDRRLPGGARRRPDRLRRPATATTTRRTTRTTRTPTTSRSTSRSPTTTRPMPALAALPFASLHIGAGAHSDADNVGLGQRYISYRKRQAGDAQYGNAIEPIQDAGQVYDTLMQRVNADLRQGLEPARHRHRRSCARRSSARRA